MSARMITRARERQLRRDRGRSGRRTRAAIGAGAAVGATVVLAPAANAATFTVTSLDDSNADGTLRGSIVDANQTLGDDVVMFASGLSGTITLDQGQIEIANEGGLEILGPGAGQLTVDGDAASRIFYLHSFTEADQEILISGLTLTGGYSSDPGGAVYTNDDADYGANLTIRDSVLTGNSSDSAGGAVYNNDGNLAIVNSTLEQNQAGSGGGAVFVSNTDEGSTGEIGVLIEGSRLSDNHTDNWGGALYLDDPDGTAVISRSTLSGNDADSGGGAVDVVSVGDGGDFIVDQSTISGNTSEEEGGGMNLDGVEGATVIRNSTISNNTVTDFYNGGALYWEDAGAGDDPVIHNSTIAGNSTPQNGGAIYLDTGGPIVISSSIVADNSADDGDLSEDDSSSPEGFELGFSLIEDTGGNGTIAETPAGSNIFELDPALGPLQSNGGPTQTQVPALTSTVVDAGIANGLSADQRGLVRAADLAIAPNAAASDGTDIGSVEIQAADCQGNAGALKIDGTDNSDTLTGTEGPDAIFALAGDDSANALGGNDCVAGDAGKDVAAGGAGTDELTGGPDKDKLKGQGGKDRLRGDAGKDALKGGGGKDRLAGGQGKDKLSGGGGNDRLKGGPGKDRIKGGGGKDRINCGGGKGDVAVAQPKDRVGSSCETEK